MGLTSHPHPHQSSLGAGGKGEQVEGRHHNGNLGRGVLYVLKAGL